MKLLIYLTIALMFFGADASAQTKKKAPDTGKKYKAKKHLQPVPLAQSSEYITIDVPVARSPGTMSVYEFPDPTVWPVITTPEPRSFSNESLNISNAQPVISIEKLIKYPEIARVNGIEGSVLFTARVKGGLVYHVEIERSDNPFFDDAVIEAAKKLTFDHYEHTPSGEFIYTKEVLFRLGDD